MPCELAQHFGPDQATTPLEGVVHAANWAQAFCIFRRHAPGWHQFIQIGDFILELFKEDFTDLIIDFFTHRLEASRHWLRTPGYYGSCCSRCGDHHSLWFADVCPLHYWRGAMIRLRRWRLLHECRCNMAVGRRCRARTHLRDRPILQGFQTRARFVEQIRTLTQRVMQGFQVVLQAGQRVGQSI